jgi:hypothetical protein
MPECRFPLLATESLVGFFSDGGEEIDEIAVGIAEQDGPISPGHRGWLLHPVADEGLQPLVLAIALSRAPALELAAGSRRPTGEQGEGVRQAPVPCFRVDAGWVPGWLQARGRWFEPNCAHSSECDSSGQVRGFLYGS